MTIDDIKELIKVNCMGYLDEGDIQYLFSGRINFLEFVAQIIFEVIKDSLYATADKKSLRECLKEDKKLTESEYQNYKRSIKYVTYYKNILIENYKDKLDKNKLEELKVCDMQTIEERIEGHNLNLIKYFQLTNMQYIDLLKAIISKRIVDNKKISNERFIELYNELDNLYDKLKRYNNQDEMIFNMIAIYDIENNYLTEIIYKIATAIEIENIEEEMPFNDLGFLFCFNLNTTPFSTFQCENRFIVKKHEYINAILNPKLNREGVNEEVNRLINVLYIKKMLIENAGIKNMIFSVSIDLLYSFIKTNYNVFSIVEDKTWSNKKIRIARKLFDELFQNIKNPVIRT